jgi:glyoxylase-like metal-dependent hydrolase (beta-lactamase superfamily II)
MADIQLINHQWNPFPHRNGYSIFPAFRKFDIFCSNSFIVQTPHQIIVIDPGGEDRQINLIAETVQGAIRENPRPVFIYLTHCHIDHAFKTFALLTHPGFRSHLFIHEAGAKALAGPDREIILLYLFNAEMDNISGAVPLFAEADKKSPGVSRCEIGGHIT